MISYLARFFPVKVAFAALWIIFVTVVRLPIFFEFVPFFLRISGNFDQNIIVRYSIYALQGVSKSVIVQLLKTLTFRAVEDQLFAIDDSSRFIKLRAAIPTNIAVIPGNYVIRITLRTSVHYAALQV